jgi:hypothetical protein
MVIEALVCALVASATLAGCGENEGDRAMRKQNERIEALSDKATAKYIREHRDLYKERFSKITCADVMFEGWSCWALFDGSRSCYAFVVVGHDYDIAVRPADPGELPFDCAKRHPVAD